MGNSPTSSGGWIIAIARTLESAGCNSADIFASAGINFSETQDSNSRFDVRKMAKVWEQAIAHTGNDALSLKVANYVGPTSFHALSFAIWASSTLLDVLHRISAYSSIVSDGGKIHYETRNGEISLRFERSRDQQGVPFIADAALDAIIATIVKLCRDLALSDVCPRSARFERPQPDRSADFQTFFRCPIEFDCQETVLTYAKADLEESLLGANPELAAYSDKVAMDYLSRLATNDLSSRVQKMLVTALPNGEPDQAEIASSLNMSLRSFQRRLRSEGTSYTRLLNDLRCKLATDYLQQSHYSVSEVCFALGFSSLSSFSRAFKRWKGVAPHAFRESLSERSSSQHSSETEGGTKG